MNLSIYIPLLLTVISCFLVQRNISIIILSISIGIAFIYGNIDSYGISAIIVFYAITHIYFQCDATSSKIIRTILLITILIAIALFAFHMIPGFKNILVIDRMVISPFSKPFSMYLNFDKTIAGIILFMNSRLYISEKLPDIKSIIITFKLLFLCLILLMVSGLLSGYIKFDFKIPDILFIWFINNLFFVCFVEEVIFRGIIQCELEQLLSNKYISLALASLIFGLAHFKGGIEYILLASIAGCFYGFTYQKTKRILCAIFVHFGLNLVHIILFTYP